jgi:hypothetical protein
VPIINVPLIVALSSNATIESNLNVNLRFFVWSAEAAIEALKTPKILKTS